MRSVSAEAVAGYIGSREFTSLVAEADGALAQRRDAALYGARTESHGVCKRKVGGCMDDADKNGHLVCC